MTLSVRPQPLLAVRDVEKSSAWYCGVLGGVSAHGGVEYERVNVDGQLVLQLHKLDVGHHHGVFGDPEKPLGNGFAVWFEVDDLDGLAGRVAAEDVQTAVHENPNAGHRELWVRDPDGYLVVFAGK
ncbi:VOC family protein [Kribbella lupini]|uniref:VOC domain-containing protein n=1 Tax=Kribbella lupini TaxID=291602 RepID=A0ABN2CAB6_9ACTN